MSEKLKSSDTEITIGEEGAKEKVVNPITGKANDFFEEGLKLAESVGISREMVMDILDDMTKDDDFISKFLRGLYKPERIRMLKKDFDEVFGEKKWEIADDDIFAAYSVWKEDKTYKNKPFQEFLKYKQETGKVPKNGIWKAENIDLSGGIHKKKIEQAKKELRKDIESTIIQKKDIKNLITGAITGKHESRDMEAKKETALKNMKKDKKYSKDVIDLLREKFDEIVSPEVIKLACINELNKKLTNAKALNESNISGHTESPEIKNIVIKNGIKIKSVSLTNNVWIMKIAHGTNKKSININDITELNKLFGKMGEINQSTLTGAFEGYLDANEIKDFLGIAKYLLPKQ